VAAAREQPNTIEAKQAEFRPQPEIAVGVCAIEKICPLENPSRTFHAVCAY